MTKDEALKLALEALEALEADPLEMVADVDGHMVFLKDKAITAIKEALAQPKQDGQCKRCIDGCPACDARKLPEQEPLAWISTGPASMIHWTADKPAYGDDWVPLYTTPPQRTWVGLSDEEIETLIHRFDGDPHTLLDEVNARLKEKNK